MGGGAFTLPASRVNFPLPPTQSLCLYVDETFVCSAEEVELIKAYRESKRNFVTANKKKRKFNQDGTARKAYTSTKRRLRGVADMFSPFSRRMQKMVKVLPALAACCFAGILQLAALVAVSQDNFAEMSQTEKWSFVCAGVRADEDRFYSAGDDHAMCWSCWVALHGFSEWYYYKARKACMQHGPGGLPPQAGPGRGATGYKSPEYYTAREFLLSFVAEYGDPMPDDQTIQLPVSSLKELFVCYCAEVDPGDQLSDSHFRAIVKNEFTYLRIHKYKKFKQCEYCLECDTKVSDMKLAPAVRQAWTERKRIHRERVRAEKQKYYHHRYKARRNPDKYLSIIIDGMDQSKVATPGWKRDSAETEGIYRTKMHCTGVLVHGRPNQTFAYLWPDRVPKDPNLTCSILLDVLSRIETKAEVLYLQIDGCTGENKNRDVFMLCAYLVRIGVFSKIKVSFLPVGHTHEDIDQLFSIFAVALRQANFLTPDELAAAITASTCSPTPTVIPQLPRIFDMKGWFEPHAFKAWEQITRYRAYKFQMHPDGYPVVFNRLIMAGRRQLEFTMSRLRSAAWDMTPAQRDMRITTSTQWTPEFGQPVLVSYPDPSTLCKAVPTKALPYDLIAGAVTSMFTKGLCTEEQVCSWEGYLDAFVKEDAAMCRTCSQIRAALLDQVESKKDTREVGNAKSRERRALGKQLKCHLRDDDHPAYPIPWPRSIQERRGVQSAEVDEKEQSESGFGGDADVNDGISGTRVLKPFIIGGVVERRFHPPAVHERDAYVGNYVAVWGLPADCEDPSAGYATIGRVTGFRDEVDELAGTRYGRVLVHWLGNAGQKAGTPSDLGGRLHLGYGVEGAARFPASGKGGRGQAFTGDEYFDSVLTWGVRLATQRIKEEDLPRIADAIKCSIERATSLESSAP